MITVRPMQYADLAIKSENDPGITMNPDGSVKSDWFVLTTVFRLAQVAYVLEQYRAQIDFPRQVKVLQQEHRRWHSWKVGIESNAYQWALGQAAIEKNVPCVPIVSVKDKVARAQMVTPHFETGRVRFRGMLENGIWVPHPSLKACVEEMNDFPFGANDDCVDSMVGAVQMCFDDEIQGQQLSAVMTPGLSLVIAGAGGRRGGDPYDVFRSPY